MHPCARCATLQRTCCQRAEVVVTLGDLRRIAVATRRRDFWERRAPTDPAYTEPDPADPDWAELTVAADGTRRVLSRRAEGDCTFLGASGCTLEREARPLVCRLYPFAYTAKGLAGVEDSYCPTAVLTAPGRTMLEVLDMDATEADDLRRQLYAELAEERSVPVLAERAS